MTATLTGLVPGETLDVFVGGQGGTSSVGVVGTGGFNGGAAGGHRAGPAVAVEARLTSVAVVVC